MSVNINKEIQIIKVEIPELKITVTEVSLSYRCPLASIEEPLDKWPGSLSLKSKSHEVPGGDILSPLTGFGIRKT